MYNFTQLEKLFSGKSQDLVMPILQDIANLVRTASDRQTDPAINKDIGRQQAVELLKKTSALLASANRTNPLSEAPAPIASALRDDRLQIDDDIDDVLTTRNLVTGNTEATAAAAKPPSHKTGRSLFVTASSRPSTRPFVPAQMDPSQAGVRSSRISDQRSYHERKLNMTNFNGTTDQYAMESEGVPIQITLPRAPMSRANDAPPQQPAAAQLTLEQLEELAFRDLNETSATTAATGAADSTVMMVRNETTGELLPMPEMLISRYRNKNNPYRKLLAAGSNGIDTVGGGGGSPRQCERFGSLCLQVEDYPT